MAFDCLSDGAAPPWTLEQGAREPFTLVLLPYDEEDEVESEVGGREDEDVEDDDH